eukprot:TRINITY_DN2222_c0_g1_i10.p1 TRINITY_DN2222_c0_g1~~TRINITY_DN2222_c0_g1_i10.p1  ORF type:complete len:618 (-),score=115.62 TRINITY_DN2222_c0_g1_i10:2242-4095(-)
MSKRKRSKSSDQNEKPNKQLKISTFFKQPSSLNSSDLRVKSSIIDLTINSGTLGNTKTLSSILGKAESGTSNYSSIVNHSETLKIEVDTKEEISFTNSNDDDAVVSFVRQTSTNLCELCLSVTLSGQSLCDECSVVAIEGILRDVDDDIENTTSPSKDPFSLDRWLGVDSVHNETKLSSKDTTATPDSSSKYKNKKKKGYFTSEPPPEAFNCPFYRRVPSTNIIVDSFQYRYKNPDHPIFFLTHFHSDHYKGLNKSFDRGLIYCSQVTANLVISRLGVKPKYVRPLPSHQDIEIDLTVTMPDDSSDKKLIIDQLTKTSNNNNVSPSKLSPFFISKSTKSSNDKAEESRDSTKITVKLYDANHCPGSVMLLFKQRSSNKNFGDNYVLHTGDFRFNATLSDHKFLMSLNYQHVFLDTTYCDSWYTFPTQQQVIDKCIEIIKPEISRPDTIIVVGSYTIGKERLFIAAGLHYDVKIYVHNEKFKIIQNCDYPPNIMNLFTKDITKAKIHVTEMGKLRYATLSSYVKKIGWPVSRVVAIKPTGWTYNGSKGSNRSNNNQFQYRRNADGSVEVWGLPYSEHSSFSELKEFVKNIKTSSIVPTVGNSSPEAVKKIINQLKNIY